MPVNEPNLGRINRAQRDLGSQVSRKVTQCIVKTVDSQADASTELLLLWPVLQAGLSGSARGERPARAVAVECGGEEVTWG